MQIMVDRPALDNCWNTYDSYGEICVGCGCCSKDKATRYKARYEVCQRRISEMENFNLWFDDIETRALQKKNIKYNLKYFKSRLRYYGKKLKESNTLTGHSERK